MEPHSQALATHSAVVGSLVSKMNIVGLLSHIKHMPMYLYYTIILYVTRKIISCFMLIDVYCV